MKNTVIDINIFIVTRNTKDFEKSVIQVKTPEELLLIINGET